MLDEGQKRGVRIEQLRFDNRALESLPVDITLRHGVSAEPIGSRDESKESMLCTYARHRIPRACYSLARATPVSRPQLAAASPYALALLELAPAEAERPEFVNWFSGNDTIRGARPAAHNYAGHQFGHFAGQLGDGACLYLGEVVVGQAVAGQPQQRWELNLKGAGKTPYSRTADGRKTLRSSVREFLACEAMHHLGIPSVRAAACMSSSTAVVRDMFHTGENAEQRCGVVLRLAESFLRFGSFEIFTPTDPVTGQAGPSAGLEHQQVEIGLSGGRSAKFLPAMLKHVTLSHFATLEEHVQAQLEREGMAQEDVSGQARAGYLRAEHLLREVVRRSERLVAMWHAVGFCHGLLNTDNMSLLGLTLDYGPYSFMETYDPLHCPCVTDDAKRYNFEAQRDVFKWNCMKFAEALSPILPQEEGDIVVAVEFDPEYDRAWLRLFRQKLGLARIIALQVSFSSVLGLF
jgi:uncharacterized protein YdiU (UPF0061 family)